MLAEAEEAVTVDEAGPGFQSEEPVKEAPAEAGQKEGVIARIPAIHLGNALKLSLVQSQQNHMWMKKFRDSWRTEKAGSNHGFISFDSSCYWAIGCSSMIRKSVYV